MTTREMLLTLAFITHWQRKNEQWSRDWLRNHIIPALRRCRENA